MKLFPLGGHHCIRTDLTNTQRSDINKWKLAARLLQRAAGNEP